MSSATVGITIWASGSVKQKPTRRRISRACRAVSSPSTLTRPDVGTTSALSIRAKVDLPEPLAPSTAIRGSVSRTVTSRSTVRVPRLTG